MILAIVIGLAGLAVIGVVLVARYLDVLTWQRSLVAFRLYFPSGLDSDDVANWLTNIAATTHAPAWSLLPLPPVAVEIVAASDGIAHYVLVTNQARATLLAGLRATFPGARLEEVPDYAPVHRRLSLAAEAVMTSHMRPLATARAAASSTALLAALQPIPRGCEICYQLIMTSAGTPSRVSAPKDGKNGFAWWEGALPRDAEAVQAARVKQQEALLRAVLRVGVTAPTKGQARALLGRVWPVLHTSNAPSVRIRRRWLPVQVVAGRMARRSYPLAHWPMLLNTAEAVGLIGFPVGKVALPGLPHGTARQLPPPPSMPSRGLAVAMSNYPGMNRRQLALRATDRLRHMYVLGPTGSGKSWLLDQMILQDIAARRGVFVIDPKGDLITEVLARIDERDVERIVVLDASRRDQPIGFNVLARTGSEEERELTVDGVLQVFKDIWAPFWGPRSDQIMRASLSTLVHSHGADGSAMTLCELVPLLTEPAFRRYVTGQPGIPESVQAFWRQYDTWSNGGSTQAINPILNKVEAFTGRTPIRLMLGQSSGIELDTIFRERKAVLVSLAKGTLGSETANLLGALLVSSLWQTTMQRVRIPVEHRRPAFAYIDEAADIMRLPIPLADMFAQARGLGLGVVAATQLIAQVPDAAKAALLGTVRTQVSFAVEHDDAVVLAKRFAPLSVDDLTNLGSYEIAMRPCLNGVTASPVTGTTVPLDAPVRDAEVLAAASRQRYGMQRADVEAAIQARLAVKSGSNGRFGRQATGDES